jgi:hypothetical protein
VLVYVVLPAIVLVVLVYVVRTSGKYD